MKGKDYLEYYDEGTLCDVSGKGRTSEILWKCGQQNALKSIIEPRSCHYQLTVETPLLCTIPWFEPERPLVQAIQCYTQGAESVVTFPASTPQFINIGGNGKVSFNNVQVNGNTVVTIDGVVQ